MIQKAKLMFEPIQLLKLKRQENTLRLHDTDIDTNKNKKSAKQRQPGPHLLSEHQSGHRCSGKRGGIGNWHSNGNGGVSEDGKECGGGGEIDEEGNGVLPDQQEVEPLAEKPGHVMGAVGG